MRTAFESLASLLLNIGKPADSGTTDRCRCGRPVFFNNSVCLGCQAPLGFDPELRRVCSLVPGPVPDTWRSEGHAESATLWKRCANFDSPVGCNWLTRADQDAVLCQSCRLNRTIPDLNIAENSLWWRKIEIAKRRLVAQLLSLGLPVASRVAEDPEGGVVFDFLRSPEGGPRVLTGHASGLITLNVEEADDAIREKNRLALREPYRTLLGHFRHEIGHYYWDRLVAETAWLEKFRALFGDERQDYAAALQRNYEQGPPPNWADQYISSYASVHPWEDWAECWAHYMHVVDSLDTSLRLGLRGEDVEQTVEPFVASDLYDPTAPDTRSFILLINSWVKLTTALNELARSMGQHDFYPFVMSRPVLRKIHFIQLIVSETGGGASLRTLPSPGRRVGQPQ